MVPNNKIYWNSPPWTLLDPITGRTLSNPTEIDSNFDPLEQQFEVPDTRNNRNPEENFPNYYLDQFGKPVYRQHKRYPYTG